MKRKIAGWLLIILGSIALMVSLVGELCSLVWMQSADSARLWEQAPPMQHGPVGPPPFAAPAAHDADRQRHIVVWKRQMQPSEPGDRGGAVAWQGHGPPRGFSLGPLVLLWLAGEAVRTVVVLLFIGALLRVAVRKPGAYGHMTDG